MPAELSNFAARLRKHFGAEWERQHAVTPGFLGQEDAFDEFARALFALQFERNESLRRLCLARGTAPERLECWRDIPAMPAAAFKELDLSCIPERERTAVFHSSGTTAQRPSRHVHSAESLAVYEWSLWPWFASHVLNDGWPPARTGLSDDGFELVLLAPPPAQAPHSSLVHMFEVIRRELNLPESAYLASAQRHGCARKSAVERGTWEVDLHRAITVLGDAAQKGRPVLILGTAFSLVHLVDGFAERHLRLALAPGSRIMETGGYKGRSRSVPRVELHALLADRLGVRSGHIVCEYGMSELSSQAYDRSVSNGDTTGDRRFRFPPWARAVVVSPETGREVADGETGLIRVFDLANVFSVMAIQTEDLAIRRGDGFELLGRAAMSESRGCSLMMDDPVLAD